MYVDNTTIALKSSVADQLVVIADFYVKYIHVASIMEKS